MNHDAHQPLREDVRALGEMLGEMLRSHCGDGLFRAVEEVRAASKSGNPDDLARLADTFSSMPVDEVLPVARAFAHFLTLANIAEQHHRTRRRREYERNPQSTPQPGSCADVFDRLLAAGVGPDALAEAVIRLRVELVLTAHPTAITRPTLWRKHQRVAGLLAERDRPDTTVQERASVDENLRREILSMWGTDDVRVERPAPEDEVRGGLLVFEQTLWNAVPRCLRLVDMALRRATGFTLPLDAAPITFGSWIGGDRDGNPAVTAEVTRRACELASEAALRLYKRDIENLWLDLTILDASPELRDAAGGAREPYRFLLRSAADAIPAAIEDVPKWFRTYRNTLKLCHRSLTETGQQLIAAGPLTDAIRRCAAFGPSLVRLDVRQHADRHAALLDAVTRRQGRDGYAAWDEPRRQGFLDRILRGDERLDLPSGIEEDHDVGDVARTLRTIAALPEEALGAYVISMTERVSDVLAVRALQKHFGSALRVVPLFEEVDTLLHAGNVMRELFAHDAGMRPRQAEVMIGYSDSAKDGGRLAANWALYEAQDAVASAARLSGVDLTFFHGRGGSIGRGGGPTHLALQCQPPRSVQGRLRLTVQGEMIQAQFGIEEIALRSLEVYLTGTLDATLEAAPAVLPEWRAVMRGLADTARGAYRSIVFDDERFLEYFHAATPVDELAHVPIGSRPARRGTAGGVDALRAIPWVFAWTQTRLLLPAWVGTGEALGDALDRGLGGTLRRMFDEWPFFRATIALIEMALAAAEPRVASWYDARLVPEHLRPLGNDLRNRLQRAIDAVLRVRGTDTLLSDNAVLRRAIDVRNPYVDPINLVQVEILSRMRAGGDADTWLQRAFGVTANGIAAGMRNVG